MTSTTASMAHGHTHSATQTPNPNNISSSNNSRPLLFFVALGFGVVFTNLWIIVGVKYCFRYNRRSQQGLIDNETGEPIDLANMPRPRRRREKKLMTMEEVNERFPLTKYKVWRATREQEGLPTEGGVTAPPSRAASIKDAMMERTSTEHGEGDSIELARGFNTGKTPQTNPSSDTRDFAASSGPQPSGDALNTGEKSSFTSQPLGASDPGDSRQPAPAPILEDPEDDEDDPIRTAVPTELLQQPGDACAICIDTIEDEDEVRGLTCGHAFHAGCLDPWLTSRRACCPLCKADYFIPKPRAEGDASGAESSGRPQGPLAVPPNVWIGGRGGMTFRPRLVFGGSRFTVNNYDHFGFPILVRENRFRPNQNQGQQATQDPNAAEYDGQAAEPTDQSAPAQSRAVRFAGRLRSIPNSFRPSRSQAEAPETTSAEQQPASEAEVTPGQLEAGTR